MIYVITESLYFLVPFLFFPISTSSLSSNHQFVLCIYEFVSASFFSFIVFLR